MKINLARSWFQRNIRSQVPIIIYPRVYPTRQVWPVEREESNFRDLNIYGKLLRSYIVFDKPHIALELTIQNPGHTTITRIDVTLYQNRSLGGKKGRVTIFQDSLAGIVDFQNEYLHRTFQIPIRYQYGLLPPTSYWKNTGKLFNKSWTVEYVLEVTFRTRLFFTNATLTFPIMVVTSEHRV